jgi:hypothetical protein
MNITVNILEVASELADKDLILSYGDEGAKYRFPNGIITDLEDGTSYTEEAQDFFNNRYDYWYDFLWDLKIGAEDE